MKIRTAALAACALLGASVPAADAAKAPAREYVVLFKEGTSAKQMRKAIKRSGAKVVRVNARIATATVRGKRPVAGHAILGAARNSSIGKAPQERVKDDAVEADVGTAATTAPPATGGAEPLGPLQWDMQMINATPGGSYSFERGNKAVRVGVIDTGIDGTHPDIAPNFDAALSRNFTTDDPTIDGPCEEEPDASCSDPANVDEDGHGTHVASTIGSPLNGLGIGGVAPNVDLVNLRAGQDSGYFFLGPSLDALTYAGDNGVDVVNMSFYIDPWLYNCTANPADSPAEQREQKLVIEATQRAIDYARSKGVTPVAAEGNGHTDLGKPVSDETSPDYPAGAERVRTIDNSCKSMPTEAEGVIGVTSVGPSKRKAYYSDYGLEQADVAAPGGDSRDNPTGTAEPQKAILAAYPKTVGLAAGTIDPATGEPTTASVVKQGDAYYQWIQGTSMASPHATGVAALIVAHYGKADKRGGGVTMNPVQVERKLKNTANDQPCPAQNPFTYPGLSSIYDATCEGTPRFNGFYGEGIIDALRAVSGR